MKIAIIGTGKAGQAIGGSLVRAGHTVTFAARDAATTRQVAAAAGHQLPRARPTRRAMLR